MIRSLVAAATLVALATPGMAQETRASVSAKLAAEFKASDTNKDGWLSRSEAAARFGRMRTTKSRIDPVHQKRLTDLWFTRTDADGDGKVTLAEAQALMGRMFERYDRDGDGTIGGSERSAAVQEAAPEGTR